MGNAIFIAIRGCRELNDLQASTLFAGILPFGKHLLTFCGHTRSTDFCVSAGAAFVELYFVMSSLFASRIYYAFGFLALTAGVVALTTATVSILFTYFLLCAEEYRYEAKTSGSNDLRVLTRFTGGTGARS